MCMAFNHQHTAFESTPKPVGVTMSGASATSSIRMRGSGDLGGGSALSASAEVQEKGGRFHEETGASDRT